MSEVQGNVFQSDVGGKEGKEGYIGLLFGHLSRMSYALNNSELASQSGNIYFNALLIINHIPDSKLRKELQEKLKDRIEELKTKEKKEPNVAVTTASIEIVGDVIDHIDEMLGIEKKAKISIELDCYSCKYKRALEERDNKEVPEQSLFVDIDEKEVPEMAEKVQK